MPNTKRERWAHNAGAAGAWAAAGALLYLWSINALAECEHPRFPLFSPIFLSSLVAVYTWNEMQYRPLAFALAMVASAVAGVIKDVDSTTTSSTISAPAPTITFTPAPLPVVQCGGLNWKGPTQCDRPKYYCVRFNDYYSECLHESRLPDWAQHP